MPDRETSQAIDDAAAAWAAKCDQGPLSPRDQLALEGWLATDPRRLGAFARARAIWAYSERSRALGQTFDPADFGPRDGGAGLSRRRLIGFSVAAAGAAAVLGVGLTWAGRPMRLTTVRGEVRLAPLSDGSVVTMNTASKVLVKYTQAERTIHLLEGEALFEVAQDPTRPFLVITGDTIVRAIGTAFVVRRLSGRPVEVVVSEGVVELTRRAAPRRTLSVAANTRALSVGSGAAAAVTTAMAPGDVQRSMAWREGKIAFEGDTLAEAVQEFSRYSDTRIIVADPVLGRETIAGLYSAADPAGFARAVAISLDARAEIRPGEIVLTR